jgi:hypothetical protein
MIPAEAPMLVTLRFSLDVDRDGHPNWTVDSPDLPSLHVSAARLIDCRRLAYDVLMAAGLGDVEVMYLLDAEKC